MQTETVKPTNRHAVKPLNREAVKLQKFTLIELLVVLTIIAFLAGMLIPSLLRSRQEARKTACISNLKQLGIALKLYTQEQNYYPDAYLDLGGGKIKYWCYGYDGTNVNFAEGAMDDYILDKKVLICPGFTGFISLDSSLPSTCSYGINAEYLGGNPEGATENDILNSAPANTDAIRNPDKTIAFLDSAQNSGGLKESYYFWARYAFTSGAEHEARTHFRHHGKTVAVFGDGHCEEIKPDAVANESLSLGWPSQYLCERD
jgi:prepilin-type N-terminal cleavage/methylation domain-containing protein